LLLGSSGPIRCHCASQRNGFAIPSFSQKKPLRTRPKWHKITYETASRVRSVPVHIPPTHCLTTVGCCDDLPWAESGVTQHECQSQFSQFSFPGNALLRGLLGFQYWLRTNGNQIK
jgi:hypothetical protein